MSKQTESTEQPRLFSRAGRPGATVGALPEASDPTTSPAADLLVGRGVPVPAAPVVRPRRLRRTPALRDLVAQTRVAPAQLIAPVFVREGISGPVPIGAMPGVVQHTLA